MEAFWDFLQVGIVGNFSWGNMAMIAVGCLFIYLGIAKDYEPLLLVPIGFGILLGNIPFTAGGGIASVEDVRNLLNCGADKISVNTAAVRNPQLIKDLADNFGSQCVVLAVDTKCIESEWFVFLNGGRVPTEIKTLDWVKQAVALGAGEILLTDPSNLFPCNASTVITTGAPF